MKYSPELLALTVVALDEAACSYSIWFDHANDRSAVELLAEAVLDALVVQAPNVTTEHGGRIRLDWPAGIDPDRNPADGLQNVLVDARLLDRLVDQLNGYRDALGVRDFAAPTADPPPPVGPVRWAGPDPRDEGYTEAEVAAAWALARVGRLPAAEAYVWSILRDYMGSRAYAVAEATSFATTPDERAAVREAARVLGVAP